MHLTKDEIISKANKIMREQIGLNEDQITPNASFLDDLGCDSLDIIELTMGFEDEFNIRIDDDETDNIETVQQAYDLLSKKLAV